MAAAASVARPSRHVARTFGSAAQCSGSGSSETDYLNGEVILLGRLHGVPTPANEVLQLYVDRMAKERQQPGAVSIEELREQVALRELAIGARA